MTSLPERGLIMDMVAEAMTAGARQDRACQAITLSERTLQRWQSGPTAAGDGRPERRQVPRNQLSTQERAQVLSIANSAAFGHLPPSQIVPRLVDNGEYVASESTFYRVLKAANQLRNPTELSLPLRRNQV